MKNGKEADGEAHGPPELGGRVVPGPGTRGLAHAHRQHPVVRRGGPADRRGDRPRGVAPAHGAALPPQALVPAAGDGPAAVGGRPELQHRLPRPPDRPARARDGGPAAAAGRPDLQPASGPLQAAVGAVAGRGARGRSLCGDQQDPPLPGGRGLRRRPDGGHVRPRARWNVRAGPRQPLAAGTRARRRGRGRARHHRPGGRAAGPGAPCGVGAGQPWPHPDPGARGRRRRGRGGLERRGQRARDAAERTDGTAQAPDLGAPAARRPEAHQARAGRHGQRRLPDRRLGCSAPLVAHPWRGHGRTGAALGRSGLDPRVGHRGRPGQPDHDHDRAACPPTSRSRWNAIGWWWSRWRI